MTLRLACMAGGRITLSAPTIGNGVLTADRYRCSEHRAVARLSLSKDAARQIARVRQALGTVTLSDRSTVERLSVTLTSGPQPTPSFWTSVFGLRCNAPGYQGQLIAPNFSDSVPTTIDVRPWLAWYTNAGGWHWLGTVGVNRSQWYEWTATPSGVAEWQTPGGAITPWTWSPLSVTPGNGTYVVAVFEAIYWYGHPEYVWSYARSIEDGDAITTYCSYP